MRNITNRLPLLLISFLILLLTGCGEKGPPLPPIDMAQQITAPYDLKAVYKTGTVFLNWSHRIDPIDAQVEPEHFDVFMARLKSGDCEDCPFEFRLAAKVPMPDKAFFIKVKSGYKYYFRVQAVGKNGLKSGYSKTVQAEAGK